MTEDFDAGALAARATGEAVDEAAGEMAEEMDVETPRDSHAAAEGTESSDSLGSVDTLREMALSSDPDIPLDDVDDPWNPDAGGVTRIYRGLLKAFDFDGVPAVVDIAIGIPEAWYAFAAHDPDSAESDEGDDQEAANFEGVSGA